MNNTANFGSHFLGPAAAILLLGGAAITTALGQGGAEPLLESPWRSFKTGEFPSYSAIAIELADMDGDGDLDAVVGHDYYGAPGIVVLRGDGDGAFADPESYETPYNKVIGDVSLADVDGDGRMDVLATIPDIWGSTNLVGYWRNMGDGTLAARREFLTGAGPTGLTTADFTGDGFVDVATANFGRFGDGNTISILPHNGQSGSQAGFLAPRTFAATSFVSQVKAADLDGDGDVDLAAGSAGSQGNAVLFNEGSGSFGAPTLYDHASGASNRSPAIALDDVNNDDAPDLIATAAYNGIPNYGLVAVRLNNGAGVFAAAITYRMNDWSWMVKNIVTADINDDGWRDILCVTPSSRTMDGYYILMNDGGGGFEPSVFYEAAKSTWDVKAVDIDQDTDLDVLTCAYDSSVVTVHKNLGGGSFYVPVRNLVGVSSADQEHGDIDGDGDPDIVTCDADIRILECNGDGTFASMRSFDSPFVPGSVKLRDLDVDGDLDLVIGPNPSDPPYNFATALNNGDGTFQRAVVTPVGASQGGAIDAIDLNNDGPLDIVLTDPGPADVIYIFRNNGSGTSFTFVNLLDDSSWIIDGADFNHDGNNDLIASTAFGVTVWPGVGDFTFDDFLSEGVQANSLDITDLDGDDNHDLVLLLPQPSFGTTSVATMLGYGDGDFAFPNEYEGPSGREGAYRIALEVKGADITGDGFVDLVLGANAPSDISVFPGGGDGTLQPAERYGAGYSSGFVDAADYNSDGAIDIATMIGLAPGGFQDAVVVLENLGEGGGGGNPSLSVTGSCPGAMTLTATNATPNGTVAFIYAFGRGSVRIPSGACAGTELGLNATATLLQTVRADATGAASMTGNAPASACGRVVVQALDVSTCAVSNIEAL